ncbi:hypothetical protein, partial [Micromonospora sp. NPDC005172]|uniref:hypothetical protein n=1 Tax=Micromonospora sp. NPDC005172 TaxID=3156867 RepID=UPI0033BF8394
DPYPSTDRITLIDRTGCATHPPNPQTKRALSARDGMGKAVFTSPTPFMWDSSIDGEAAKSAPEAPQTKVGTDTARKKDAPERKAIKERVRRAPMKVSLGRSDLTIVPDQGLLTDPDAELPIHIDPAWSGSVSGSSWTSVWSKHKSSSF